MKIQIKNIQYFEWEVPEELCKNIKSDDYDKLQQLIDEYFVSDDVTVEQISDDYYELEQSYED